MSVRGGGTPAHWSLIPGPLPGGKGYPSQDQDGGTPLARTRRIVSTSRSPTGQDQDTFPLPLAGHAMDRIWHGRSAFYVFTQEDFLV